MKKTQVIDLLHNIKATRVSFIALIMFIALGISFFTGLSWTADGFLLSTHNEVEDAGLYDAEIVYPYGFDDEDVEKFDSIDGVDDIEGFKIDYAFLDANGKNKQIKINQVGKKLNRFAEIEGAVPETENEIAFEKTFAEEYNVKIGDTIVFKSGVGREQSNLINNEFVVTAIVVSPLYIGKASTTYGFASNNIAIDGQAFACDSAFKQNVLNAYSSVSIRSNSLRGINTFSKEYTKKVNEFIDFIDGEVSEIINARFDKICSFLPEGDKPAVCGYTITPRIYNSGIIALKLCGDSFYKARYSLAALFLVVGMMVCYSSVTRFVHDQAILIGMKKALGMSNKSITLSYLVYSGLTVLIGVVVSLLISLFVIEPILYAGTARSFLIGHPGFFCSFGLTLICMLGEMILILLCAFLACRSVLKRKAVDLLNEKEKVSAKSRKFEKLKIRKKLPLFFRFSANNSLNNKRRVFATIIGVAGCTALIACGMTVNNNIRDSFDRQYSEIFLFDNIVCYEGENSGAKIQETLSVKGIDSTEIETSFSGLVMPDGQKVYAQIFVPLQDNKDDFFHIIPCGKTISEPGEGVWMNVSYADEYGAEAGDMLKLIGMKDGLSHDVTISGFYENYMTKHQLIMSADSYQDIFAEKPISNSLAFRIGEYDLDKLEEELSNIDGFVSLNRYKEISKNFFDTFTSAFNIITCIYLAMSVVMALLVLLNLFVMFVDEKKKESIVMIINGYNRKRIKAFLNRDCIFLSVIGILIGLILGTGMAILSIHSFESGVAHFLKVIDWKACLIAVAGSTALLFAMMKIALRRVDKFTLSDINRP